MNYYIHRETENEYLVYSIEAEKDIIYVYFDGQSNAVNITHIELSDVVVNVRCCKADNAVKLREVRNTVVVDVDTLFDSVKTETAYFC